MNYSTKKERAELLLPSASDRDWVGAIAKNQRRRLDDERLAGFNHPADLSTYPRKISVRTTRATAAFGKMHRTSKQVLAFHIQHYVISSGSKNHKEAFGSHGGSV
jgi:hypothetical protein